MRHYLQLSGLISTASVPTLELLRDRKAARAAAVKTLRQLMAARLTEGKAVPSDWSIAIVNEAEQVIEVITSENAALEETTRKNRHWRLYAATLHPYLLLTPDLAILEANPAYLNVTMSDLDNIRHRPMFDAFPDNPAVENSSATRNLSSSLLKVLARKESDVMPVQRYDLRRPGGSWEERYWNPVNFPLLNENGDVELIAHHVEDVTSKMISRGRTDTSEGLGEYEQMARECELAAGRVSSPELQRTLLDLAWQWRNAPPAASDHHGRTPTKTISHFQHNMQEASQHLHSIAGHSADLILHSRQVLLELQALFVETDKVLRAVTRARD